MKRNGVMAAIAAPDGGTNASKGRRPRLAAIDAARGAALVAMIVYHLAYDLDDLGLATLGAASEPGWRWFARAIAASFLTLSGVSLALAHGGGLRRSAFLKRLAIVAGAALLVSIGTALYAPSLAVRFGILHCIAAGSVLALPALRAPAPVVAMLAAAVLIAPFLLAEPALNGAGWSWLGLNTQPLRTLDHVPLLPWFAFTLLGALIGRRLAGSDLAHARHEAGPLARGLARAGRHSLAVYLFHQPLLIGALLAGIWATGFDRESASFLADCQASCRPGLGEAACRRYCPCVRDAARREALWTPLLRQTLTPEQASRVGSLALACRLGAGGP